MSEEEMHATAKAKLGEEFDEIEFKKEIKALMETKEKKAKGFFGLFG